MLFLSIFCRYKWYACRLTCTDKFPDVPTKLQKGIIGGAVAPPAPPLATLVFSTISAPYYSGILRGKLGKGDYKSRSICRNVISLLQDTCIAYMKIRERYCLILYYYCTCIFHDFSDVLSSAHVVCRCLKAMPCFFSANWRRTTWDQSREARLKCYCDAFDRDRCMN